MSINIAPYNVHQQSVADVYQTLELDMDRENVAVSTSSLLSRLKDRGTNTEVSPIVYGPLTTEQYRAITMGLGVQNDGIANPSLLNNGEFTSVFTVNTLLDVVDPNDGYTSLREAIISANTFAGRDLINFAEGLTGTIQLCGVEMTITSSMEIRGPGADLLTIDAGGRSRVFRIIGDGSTTDPTPTLAAPLIISCVSTLDGDGVDLVWIGSSGATGYAIYRKDPGKSWQFIDAVGQVSTYTDTDLTPDTTYQYYIVAFSNVTGAISVPSNTVTVTTNPVLWIDLAIDSLNTSRFAGPSQTDAEDQIEDDPNHFGKIIQPNYGDYDNDGVLDIWDGYTGSGQTQSAANASERFVPIVISIPEEIDLDNASFQFDYWMGSVTMTGYTQGSPPRFGDGNIRIWNKDGNEARSANSLHLGGNLVMDSMSYTAAQLGFTSEIRTITLYVEGHTVSSSLGNREIIVRMEYELDGQTKQVEDKVKYTVKEENTGWWVESVEWVSNSSGNELVDTWTGISVYADKDTPNASNQWTDVDVIVTIGGTVPVGGGTVTLVCIDPENASGTGAANYDGTAIFNGASTISVEFTHGGSVTQTVTASVGAHAGDNYSVWAVPSNGEPYTESEILTVWRRLWVELDQMAMPEEGTKDGFPTSTKGTQWDTSAPTPEPVDFDVLTQPDKPDISLLQTAMLAACIKVEEVPQGATGTANSEWITGDAASTNTGEWDNTTPFVHNLSAWNNDVINAIGEKSRDVNVNTQDFWCIQGVGAYESELKRCADGHSEDMGWEIGVATDDGSATFLIFHETIRDFNNTLNNYDNSVTPRSTSELNKLATFHEVLHMFDFQDDLLEDGKIMTTEWYVSSNPITTYTILTPEQIQKIQKKDISRHINMEELS